MGNDKISTCIKDWIEIQERRVSNMSRKRTRVETSSGESFYGSIHITQTFLIIIPDDSHVSGIYLDEPRLNGVNEVGEKGITLLLRHDKPSITIYFRSPQERNDIITKIRIIISDSSTSESPESSSPEAN
ncbi:uncharacterized protein [Euwallacea similis]|uniref:uncharacterized protein n=1 Tax=Euwallacea similis TaxID=1736056 RepID=UPI00344C3BF0